MKFICPFCRSILSIDNNDLGIDVQCGQCGEICRSPLSLISTNVVIGNDFIILEELGRGGMGVVYLTHQISLDRPAALKILAKKYADNNEFVAGFIKEARAAAKLNHPNIVQAYAVGEDSGIYYFAMEYIGGETMKDVLKKQGKIPVDQAVEIVRQIADALDFAWKEQRLIHRDIKPDNIMIVSKNQRAKLADLGLARVAGEIDDSSEDEVMGTPQYISPEALIGSPMDVRSDIYSLGATFYHLVTGSFPFTGKNALEIAKKHLQEQLKNPRILNPEISESVAAIIMKMMEKSPDDRYQTAESLVEDLRIAKRGGKISSQTAQKKGKTVVFHTSQIKVSSQHSHSKTGASTQDISTFTPKNIGAKTYHSRVSTASIRIQKEEKAKKQFIIMIVLCIIALIFVIVFVLHKQSKREMSSPKTESAKNVTTQSQIVNQKNLQIKEPENTEFTEAAAKILAFAKENPGARSDILAKCDWFLQNYKPSSYKCDKDALNALLAIYIPLDEKYRLADARKREHESRMAVIQRRIDEEKRRKMEEEERLKIQQKEEEIARLKLQREEEMKRKIEEYASQIRDRKLQMAFKAVMIVSEKNDFAAATEIFEEAKKEPDAVEIEFKDIARDFSRWSNNVQQMLQKAKSFHESLADRREDAIKVNLEIRPGVLARVQQIKNGEVFAETPSRKQEKAHILQIPVSQFKRLSSVLYPDKDASFLYYMFNGKFEDLSQLETSDVVKQEAELFTEAFLRGRFKEINAMPEADKQRAMNEFRLRYGRIPKFKEIIDGMRQ